MPKILALGETRHGTHNTQIKEILITNNFDAIFLELPNDFQGHVDRYIETGKFPSRLKQFIDGSLREGNDVQEFLEIILDYASRDRTPVVCIDSSKSKRGAYVHKSKTGNWHLKGKTRDEDMFRNILSSLKNTEGNFLVIAGANHLSQGIHPKSNQKTLGSLLKNEFGKRIAIKILEN